MAQRTTAQHNAKAARRFLKRQIARFGEPRVILTDVVHPLRNQIYKIVVHREFDITTLIDRSVPHDTEDF